MPKERICPLTVVLQKLNLNRRSTAEAAGCSYSSIGNAETGFGTVIPAAVRVFLTPLLPSIGSSIEKLDSDFRLWRIARREALRRETEGVSR